MARKHSFLGTHGVPEGLRDLFDNLVVVAPWVRIDRMIPGALFVPDEAARAAGYLVGAGVIAPKEASPVEELIRQAGPTSEGEFVAFLYVASDGDELHLARLVAREESEADASLCPGSGEVIGNGIVRWKEGVELDQLNYLVTVVQPPFRLVAAVESSGGVADLIDEIDRFVVETFGIDRPWEKG